MALVKLGVNGLSGLLVLGSGRLARGEDLLCLREG